MTSYSTIAGLPSPDSSDLANMQSVGNALTAALDLVTIPHFASDSAVSTAIPSPTDGQLIMRTDIGPGCLARWSAAGSRWIYDTCLLAEAVLGANAASVTFSAIPQKHTHLRLVASSRTDDTSSHFLRMRANNASSANYDYQALVSNGSGGSGAGQSTAATNNDTMARIGNCEATANYYGTSETIIPYYTNNGLRCQSISRMGYGSGSGLTIASVYNVTNLAVTTTSLVLLATSNNLGTGSRFSLYGLS